MHDLDIVIPVLNEENSIEKLIDRIIVTFKDASIAYKIIVVDDNSTDGTYQAVLRLKEKYIRPRNKQFGVTREVLERNHLVDISILRKLGQKGKAYSLIQGIESSDARYVAIIDGDLQYPPEKLVELYNGVLSTGISIANRVNHKEKLLRKIGSKINRLIFGKMLHGIDCDIQSGLKIFDRNIYNQMDKTNVTGWTFDLALIKTALDLGNSITEVNIDFKERKEGLSKINFLKTTKEIVTNSLKLWFEDSKVYRPSTLESNSLYFRGKKFTTYTDLADSDSAIITFSKKQKKLLIALFFIAVIGLVFSPFLFLKALIVLLTSIYFLDTLFSFFILTKGLANPQEIKLSKSKLDALVDEDLPLYTILCPLYKEAEVLPNFVRAIKCIEWPKDKLEVLLLLEESDLETQEKAREEKLPNYFKVVVVPDSQPKTKPKACNYGLNMAQGKYIVVYDAEDRPDPKQLKKAYLRFINAPSDVVCLQSKLNYYNKGQNILTRLFTAEYSLWFDLSLPGLQSLNTIIPLGGTSNHFKTDILKYLNGWDPFNVTEDCDLGVRLFKKGFRTEIIDSTTYEEANSEINNWIRQRSRWIKGYFQTYLVHSRDAKSFYNHSKIHLLLFNLIIGLRTSFLLINPLLWIVTLLYFFANSFAGSFIESLYLGPVFYFALFSMIAGNFLYLYQYMIGLAKRNDWSQVFYVFLIPFYWILSSYSSFISFRQLLKNPYYWEKTNHGLMNNLKVLTNTKKYEYKVFNQPSKIFAFIENFSDTLNTNLKKIFAPSFLVGATLLAGIINYVYSIYLTRSVDYSLLGELGLFSALAGFVAILSTPLSETVTYLVSKKESNSLFKYFNNLNSRLLIISALFSLMWLSSSSFLANYFNVSSELSFYIFVPFILLNLVSSVRSGILSGKHKFVLLAIVTIIGPLSRFSLLYSLLELNKSELLVLSFSIPAVITYLLYILFSKLHIKTKLDSDTTISFPKDFYFNSLLSKISLFVFLNADLIIAKHFLSPEDAGKYTLISIIGKTIYFIGGLFTQFITPYVGREIGTNNSGYKVFYKILTLTFTFSLLVFIAFGIFGSSTVPMLFGSKSYEIITYLPLYAFGIFAFTLSSALVNFHRVRKEHSFSYVLFILAMIEIISLYRFDLTLSGFVTVVSRFGVINLFSMILLHYLYAKIHKSKLSQEKVVNNKLTKPSVLIYNWRDTKHMWAGGAEIYLHELAKRLVKNGYRVTVFCGNDNKHAKHSMIDGVEIVRKGNFNTVYIWGFLYYVFVFRNKYNFIIDSENGIPFFTPLYSSLPKVLLIHHIHQEVFANHLPWYKRLIANFLESFMMPIVYRNVKKVTVSESSKKDIIKMGLGLEESIEVITPGVDLDKYSKRKKTRYPTLLYVGRLKKYKSLDTLIKSVPELIKKNPNISINIAGFGEDINRLKELAKRLGIGSCVHFLGKISEERKAKLMASSWIFVYPSTMEGFGIAAVEAQASGTAVVAANVKGLRDSVKDKVTGLLFKPKDHEDLTKKIMKLINDDKLLRKIENNAIVWSRNFTWNKSYLKVNEIITNSTNTKNTDDFAFVQ